MVSWGAVGTIGTGTIGTGTNYPPMCDLGQVQTIP